MFLFITDLSLWPGGKCLSRSCKNTFPTFVSTSREKGGLNQVTLFLFFLFPFGSFGGSGGEYCNLWVSPHLSNSAWCREVDKSNTSLFAEISESLLFTPMGIFFKMEGGGC